MLELGKKFVALKPGRGGSDWVISGAGGEASRSHSCWPFWSASRTLDVPLRKAAQAGNGVLQLGSVALA